jgi:hypothetical protein
MSNTNKHNLPPGMQTPYNFDIKQILSRALELSKRNNWTLAQVLICIILVTFAIYFIFIDAYGITNIEDLLTENNPLIVSQQATIELTITCLLAPLWAGVAMLAINSYRGLKVNMSDAFYFYKQIIVLAAASVILSITFTLGLSLYVLPGFYIFTATTFALPLITDKKMRPFSAIIVSIKMVNKYLPKMLMLYAIFIVMFIPVLLSFGFAYLWVGPFYFNVKAILYQDLFCEKEKDPIESTKESNVGATGVFDA